MDNEQRFIVCTNFKSNADNTTGRSIALFEKDMVSGRYERVNSKKYFCEDDDCQVYITPNDKLGYDYNNYLEDKFKNRLYLLQCIENKSFSTEVLSSHAKNRSNLYRTEAIEPRDVCEVIELADLPDSLDAEIEVDLPPLTRHIFIRTSGFSYGPFEYNISDNENGGLTVFLKKPNDTKYIGRQLMRLSIFKFDNLLLSENYELFKYENKTIDGKVFNKSFYYNVSDFKEIDCEQINFAFPEEIEKAIGIIIKETNTKGIAPNQVTMLTTRLKSKKTNFNFDVDFVLDLLKGDKVFEKVVNKSKGELKSIIASNIIGEQSESRNEILEILKSDQSLIEQVKDEIRQNEFELNESIQDLAFSEKKSKEQLELIKREIEKEKNKLREVSSDTEKKAIEELKRQQTSLNDEIQLMEDKKTSLTKKYSEVFEFDELTEELKLLKSEIEKAKNQYEIRLEDKRSVEKKIEIQQEELKKLQHKEADEYKKGLLNVKSSIDVLTQFEDSELVTNFSCISKNELTLLDSPKMLCEFIKYTQISLSEFDRQISIEQIINIFTCIEKSFVTILSGLPGTGKTSLATLLNEHVLRSRFNSIQVGRGWTSERDLLGYFNPITNRYISSGTGMYEFLEGMKDDDRFNIVLLDEANLSPIEHYWSKFMWMSDDFSGSVLKLSNNKTIEITSNLRFIATINNDMTTEPLSPRLLDRAVCIRLDVFNEYDDGSRVGLDLVSDDEDERRKIIDMFGEPSICLDTFKTSFKMCELEKNDVFFDVQEKSLDTIERIKKILTDPKAGEASLGSKIHISPRRMTMIRRYLESSIGLYSIFAKEESDWLESQKPYSFLDFSISEFILPLISGHGKAFRRRLELLLQNLQDLEKSLDIALSVSSALLCDMLSQGEEDLDTYDFMSLR